MLSNTLTSPNYTDLVRIMEGILDAEINQDEKTAEMRKELDFIYEFVDTEIRINLAVLEMLIFYQLQHNAQLNKEVDIDGVSWKMLDLYKHIDGVNKKLIPMIIHVAKKYSFDIPIGAMGSASKLQL